MKYELYNKKFNGNERNVDTIDWMKTIRNEASSSKSRIY